MFYETRGATFFHTLDWLKVYWQHSQDDERLRVFLVLCGSEILGILPLVQCAESVDGRAIETVRYPSTKLAESSGPIGPNPTLTLRTVAQHLADRPWELQRLVLTSIYEHDHGRTANAMQLSGLVAQAISASKLYRIDVEAICESDSDGFEQQIQSETFFERFRPQAFDSNENDLCESALVECFEMFANEYVRDVAFAAMHQGMLDLCLLRHCDELLAFSLNTCVDGSVRQLVTCDAVDHSPVELVRHMVSDGSKRNDERLYLCGSGNESSHELKETPIESVAWEYQATTTFKNRFLDALSVGRR